MRITSHRLSQRRSSMLILLSLVIVQIWFVQPSTAADPCAVPVFAPQTTFNLNNPRAIAAGDFNNDGKVDLASVNNRTSGLVSILLGNGLGGFSSPASFSGARQASSIAIGDLNNDGNADVIVGNESNTQGEFRVWLGDGTGTTFALQPPTFLFGGGANAISSVALGDLNNDGKLDAVLSSTMFNSLFVLFGDGTGKLTFHASIPSGGVRPNSVVIRDLNADNKLDLVLVNAFATGQQDAGSVSTFLGNSNGDFATPTSFLVGGQPGSVAVGDFNGDTKPDAAVANALTQDVHVLLGDGGGNLGSPVEVGLHGLSPQRIASADFNSDGKADVVVFTANPISALVLGGDGAGGLTPVANVGSGEDIRIAGAVADLNSDTRPDLVLGMDRGPVTPFLNACGSTADSSLQFSTSAYQAFEGAIIGQNQTLQIQVTRTGNVTGAASVDYATANGTAHSTSDYTSAAGTLNFAPGETFKSFATTIINDDVTESVEDFNLALTDFVGASSGPFVSPIFTIVDDDLPPTISVGDVSITEGDVGTAMVDVPVTLSHPSAFTITVNFATGNDSATAGADYQATSGTLTFNPLELTGNIQAAITGDLTSEINEVFSINLSDATNTTLADAQGRVEILDDDSSCPGPSFGNGNNVAFPVGPFSITSADFNGDGKVDLVTANVVADYVSLLLGDGRGGFAEASNFAVGAGPRAVAAADVNLDGKMDVVTGNMDIDRISVLLGDGSGGFASAVSNSSVTRPVDLVVGNTDPDGKPDLIVVSITGTVSVLRGDGLGGFALGNSYAVGTSPVSVTLADLNNDAKADIVVANQNSNGVSVLLGNGDATFAAKTDWTAGANPQSVVSADFNGDGKIDLAVANMNSNDVTLLVGNGAGSFVPGGSLPLPHNGRDITTGDLNGDGSPDLVIANTDDGFDIGVLSVFFGNGVGFSGRADYTVGMQPTDARIADFNNDGRSDLVVTNFRSNNATVFLNSCASEPAEGSVRFGSTTFTANEGDLMATVTVTRSGNTAGAATVKYMSSDDSASSLSDYTLAAGQLSFGVGESAKTFDVLIADDSLIEGNELLTLTLSEPVGAALGPRWTVNLTIVDNDSSASNANPLDDAQFFVRQHYSDFLNRAPDFGGHDYWSNQITSCGTDLLCVHQRRIGVSAAFFVELEFQRTGYVVYRAHRAAFGTWPNTTTRANLTYSKFMGDRSLLPEGANIQQSSIDYANGFVQRPEFLSAFPNSQTNAEFVAKLFDTAELLPYIEERQQQIDAMNNNGKTRAQVLLDVIEIAEFKTREYNRSFVLMQYFGYLRRDPDQGGYDFWLNILNNREPNNYRSMVCGFITSAEYQQRFGTAVTRTNADCAQ